VIFGAVIDEGVGDEIRVTVIATGFGTRTPRRRRQEAVMAPAGAPPIPSREPADVPSDSDLEIPASCARTDLDAAGFAFRRAGGRESPCPLGWLPRQPRRPGPTPRPHGRASSFCDPLRSPRADAPAHPALRAARRRRRPARALPHGWRCPCSTRAWRPSTVPCAPTAASSTSSHNAASSTSDGPHAEELLQGTPLERSREGR
jgi:hypothetical protein